MANVIPIRCPKCRKELKVPDALIGKTIKCKGCETKITITPPREDRKAAEPDADLKPVTKPVPRLAHGSKPEESDAEGAFTVRERDDVHRCPDCAKALSEHAVVCTHCGFNQLTHSRLRTKFTYEISPQELLMYRMPAFLCIAGILAFLGFTAYVCFGMESTWQDMGSFGIGVKVWTGVFCAAGCWFMGRFAYHRLVVQTRPPEEVRE